MVMSLVFAPFVAEAKPWAEHAQKLAAFSHQIEQGESEIHELIEEKRHSHDANHVAEIMKSIGERQRAIEKASSQYEEERQHVRFQHPEKNDQLDHVYVRHEVKSVDELENDLGIDARLDRVKARVLAKFPIPDRTQTAEAQKFRTRLPASKAEVSGDDVPEKIKLVK
jgi:hypothetical protein